MVEYTPDTLAIVLEMAKEFTPVLATFYRVYENEWSGRDEKSWYCFENDETYFCLDVSDLTKLQLFSKDEYRRDKQTGEDA